eukprot:m.22959 g.22959  ORF g.22959 m.22959 type:complete len:158 (+) comp10964_c1_seq2:647-1120(+)
MGRLRHKRMHKNHLKTKKTFRTKRRTKDVDQVHEDLQAENVKELIHFKADGDLPGLGQFYCIHCARHFVDDVALQGHLKSSIHKRRVRQLKDEPYTQAEADAAGGLGQYVKKGQVTVPSMEELHAVRQGQGKSMVLDGGDDAAIAAAAAAGQQQQQP